ncbi:DUF3536 domain-containing protein [Methanoculleus oceani]|uniref:Glycoside hydrolase n=1 Tax=Methanoculleus oceani TaxID=2184756 RepID=A0ABD4TAW9_9EURY|nr:glycoside hydrolase [Methanoculleus sp. CWC-02]
MDRAVCIHGHFYQPSRENPWLGDVGVQRSAAPYHDWNERVTAECYGPNTAARILDADGLIEEVVNTYSRISFTAAPTLLAWLERHRPEVYGAVVEADRESRERYAGHGSAIACCYNHLIMPLATRRDKQIQVAWGVRDFTARFGREPEGMWLPETAVDLESLDLVAGAGIRFTILAPHQAGRVRSIGAEDWTDVSGGRVDTTMPYLCRLPSGRSIAVFFYDGTIARDVAFGDLLSDGRRFAGRLLDAFSRERERPELVHIATDGETYGHHREFGEMALAYCLETLEARRDVRLTVYPEYLDAHPPTHEVAVRERTSWSCTHGLGRWRRECGCHGGAHPGWSQAWRGPLREAIVMVRDALSPRSAEALGALVRDPAEARDDAVALVLSRWFDEAVTGFFARHARRDLSPDDRRRVLAFLEIEHQAMLMQTSCGWFFDDLTEPGSVQVMRHAKRAMDLALQTLGLDIEPAFIDILRRAPVNDPRYATGAEVYEALARPAAVDLDRIGAGAALYALFDLEPPAAASGMYAARGDWRYRSDAAGRRRVLGTVGVRSRVTGEEALFDAVALFAGMDRIVFSVREPGGDAALRAVWEEVTGPDPAGAAAGAFERVYTAPDLSDEERWAIARRIAPGMGEAVCAVYRDAAALIDALDDLGIPAPGAAAHLLAHACTERLLAMLGAGCPDPDRFFALAEAMRARDLAPDLAALGEAASRRITLSLREAAARSCDPAPLEEIIRTVRCAKVFGLALTVWESQNLCIGMRGRYAGMRERAGRGDGDAQRWAEAFERAAACIGVRVT